MSSNYIYLQISNITIKAASALTLSAFLAINGSDSLAGTLSASPLFLEQVTAYSLSFSSLSLSSAVLGVTCNVTLSISLSTKAASQAAYLRIYVPLEFGEGGYGSHTIVEPISALVSGQLTLVNLTNPTTQRYSAFMFAVDDAGNRTIAISSPTDNSKTYSFKHGCTLPCRTCAIANSSQCLSCYAGISWIPYSLLSLSSSTCVDKCVDGQYLENGQCKTCDSSCKTCLTYGPSYSNGSPNVCLSCTAPRLLLNGLCYSACPAGYYAS